MDKLDFSKMTLAEFRRLYAEGKIEKPDFSKLSSAELMGLLRLWSEKVESDPDYQAKKIAFLEGPEGPKQNPYYYEVDANEIIAGQNDKSIADRFTIFNCNKCNEPLTVSDLADIRLAHAPCAHYHCCYPK